MRLDTETAARFSLSRTQAAKMIAAGNVSVGGKVVTKPGAEVSGSDEILLSAAEKFVGRGGYKLEAALDRFGIPVDGMTAVDIGASTGGFTDVMLRNGAKRVYCVDVGYNLLDYRLRSDPRVTVLERTNARFLTAEHFPEAPEFGATDVSFISLKAILPSVLPRLTGRREFVALVKPQFEAPKEDVGEKGVVRDPAVHARVLEDILDFVNGTEWKAVGLDHSPIRGQEGNIEFLLHLLPKDAPPEEIGKSSINDIIANAYDFFLKSNGKGL